MRIAVTVFAAVMLAGCISEGEPLAHQNIVQWKFVEGPHTQRCTAVVEDMHDTRTAYFDDPILTMTLIVSPPGGAAYEARIDALVPHLFVPRRGDTITVSCDPGDPANTKLIDRDGDIEADDTPPQS